MAQRKFIQATEGQLGQAPVVRNIEVCSDCGENAPKLGDNPERICKDCHDSRLGNWVVAKTSV